MTRRAAFKRGLFTDNPVAVTLIGLCPAAAVTGRVIDALWMSLGLVFVLVLTRVSQGMTHALWPEPLAGTRVEEGVQHRSGFKGVGTLLLSSCFTASFEMILLAFAPDESASLGIYIPLLAVNCIVLERFAPVGSTSVPENVAREIGRSLAQAAGLGLGFAISLVAISLVRETLGAGTITLFAVGSFGGTIDVGRLSLAPVRALAYAGGGLLCLGYLAGAARLLRQLRGRRAEHA